ncbi:protein kinase domain-containing protein [Legionella oakridgensis]|uniref:Protein kinase domain protein n=2 Tax=Legionella oakridgensis TaxID=29423 RepID=W0BFV7_9GAMM|nr:hypothetical protein [Legionella oakridgensis]AHE67586.1 protein kinase domain protein [Legionella oakridgensis ATCC 33761 = DSM 21215]ETO92827.1 kinase domain protein [Legionella oakridgensis RV-2-2007]KTD37066.1 serine/threonine-protein kinase [Legionella oakridgensis]STY20625.1 Serine/threonine protein kinase [Legionella longbeachae]
MNVIVINPLTMDEGKRAVLYSLFHSNENKGLWQKGIDYRLEETIVRLTHDVVLQHHESNYLVIGNEVFAEGRRSKVFLVEKILSMSDGTIITQDSGPLIIKRQYHQPYNNSLAELESEYNNSLAAPHLGVKQPIVVPRGNQRYISFTVMNRMPGIELFYLINGNHGKNPYGPLTPALKLLITKQLLLVLKTQVTDQGIVHQDIKPENIMVDPSVTSLIVNIVDFNDWCKAGAPRTQCVVTEGYVAPEVNSLEPAAAKTDVFSMGKVLQELWDLDKLSFSVWRRSLSSTLSEQQCAGIYALVATMSEPDFEKRFSIDEAIDFFAGIPDLNTLMSVRLSSTSADRLQQPEEHVAPPLANNPIPFELESSIRTFRTSYQSAFDPTLLPGYIPEMGVENSVSPIQEPVTRRVVYLEEAPKPISSVAKVGLFSKFKRLLCCGGHLNTEEHEEEQGNQLDVVAISRIIG